MAAVRSRGNRSTEIALGKLMWGAGLRGYRKHWPVAGTPDFAWPGRKVAIFVDGCFWHGCACKKLPETNRKFWDSKIRQNQARDRRVDLQLCQDGWLTIRVPECEVNSHRTLARIIRIIKSRPQYTEDTNTGTASKQESEITAENRPQPSLVARNG